jgi:hypothetical protein
MWTSHLIKKRGIYKSLMLINMLSFLIAPFMNSHLFAVDGGAGTAGTQEKEALLAEIGVMVKGLLVDSMKDSVKKADIEKDVKEINEKIKGLGGDPEMIKALKDQVDSQTKLIEQITKASKAQGEELAKMKNGVSSSVKETFISAAKASILNFKDKCLEEITDSNGTRLSILKYFKDGNKNTPVFEINKAVDMLQSNIVQNYVGQIRLSELVPQQYGVPVTIYPHVLEYFPSRNITRPNLSMLVTYSYSDGAGTKTEGSAGTASSFLLKTVSFPSFFIDTYIPVSDETLDDLDEVLSEINRVAPSKILDKLDEKVYADAGNDTTDMKGMFVNGDKCTDFVPATYAGTVANANFIDVIEAMVASCETNKYQPDTVGLNPTDVRLYFNSLKDQLDNSVRDNRLTFVNGQLVAICGLKVVKSVAITTDTCFVGAINRVALLGIRQNMTMEIGLNSSDFAERQKTVRIGMRVAFGVGDPLGVIYNSAMASSLGTITKATN